MNIALAGTGNVATVLGILFKSSGHEIVSVWGRDSRNAQLLADRLDSIPGEPAMNAEILIVAVSDEAIGKMLSGKKFNIPVVHTAGSVPSDILKEYGDGYGVIYPLQSLRKEMPDIPEIPFLITGSDESIARMLEVLCRTVSESVHQCNDAERLQLHLAAVLVSNFTNHLYRLAERFCEETQSDFKLLQPLIQETATRIRKIPPSKLQTGPAVRNDEQTIQTHLELLRDNPEIFSVYEFMTRMIQSYR